MRRGRRLSNSLGSIARAIRPGAYARWVTYPKVDRSHVVPRLYLRNFSDGERIAMRLTGAAESRVVGVGDAAVQKAYYRRTRPNGTEIDDVEWSLSVLEGSTAPILREVEHRWPLSLEDKVCLAEFFAAQYARGRAWRRFYHHLLDKRLDDWGSEDHGLSREPSAEELARAGEHLASDSQTLIRMLSLIPKARSIFASMRWTLIRFNGPVLVLSDEPVVCWPIAAEALASVPERHKIGLLATLEVAVPICSTCALLMTWADEPDPVAVARGRRHHAATLNALSIGQAEKQWFHRPGITPRLGAGRRRPLSAELCPSYSGSSAAASQRRRKVDEMLQPRLGETLTTEFDIFTIR